jgi:hypothetical protein
MAITRVRWFILQSSYDLPDVGKGIFTAFTFFILLLAMPLSGKANDDGDELSIFVSLQNHGAYMPALLQEETLYLPVKELFDFLKINNQLSPDMDSATGYLLDPKAGFLINYTQHEIIYNGTAFSLKNKELIRTETNLYLRSDVFGNVFGLDCNFQFRNLAVIINTKLDLALRRELRQEVLRNNIRMIKGEVKPDTSVKRDYPFFRLGTADWNIVHSKAQSEASATRINLQVGGMFAGGEALVSLSYDNKILFARQQQQYKWRFVNNNLKLFRQVSLGNLAVQSTASIYAPVIGIQVTNAPTNRRRSFGTYVISNRTQPDWMVELYVNNVLVNYVKADAAGFYSFPVPLVYGNMQITLKFFGPSGEERSSEQVIQIPFNFLPVNTLEYTFSEGLVQDSLHGRYSKADFHYGFTNRITIGGGMEYLFSVKTGNLMPFFYTTVRLSKTALLSTEFTNHVRWKSQFTWQLRSKAQVEFNYQRYTKGQRAVLTNNLEERRASVSLPIQKLKFHLLSKLAFRQVVTPTIDYDSLVKVRYSDITKAKFTSAELTLSSSFSRFNANFTTTGSIYRLSGSSIYSNLALAYHFRHGFLIRPQFQYNYIRSKFIAAKFETEKQLRNQGVINLSFARDFSMHLTTTNLGLHYNFSFLRTVFSAVLSNKTTSLVQWAGGSFLYDAQSGYATHSRQSHYGRGNLVIAPFLDLNGNGKRDQHEPGIRGLKIHINGGRVLSTKEEDVVRIADLEPYNNYLVELEEKSLGNIAWQIKNKKISVVMEPNIFKRLEVPVTVVGEASGMVFFENHIGERGISRILVNIYDSIGQLAAQTMTESDGYFNYLGLLPGKYIVRIDSAQLYKLNFSSMPATLSFQIAGSEDGVVSDGFRFVLQSLDKKEMDQNIVEYRQNEKAKQSFVNLKKSSQPVAEQQVSNGLLNSLAEQQNEPPIIAKQPELADHLLIYTGGKVNRTEKTEKEATRPWRQFSTKNSFLQSQKMKSFHSSLRSIAHPAIRKKALVVLNRKKKLQLKLRQQALQLFQKEQLVQQRLTILKIEHQRLIRYQKKILMEIDVLKAKIKKSSYRMKK